MLNHCNWWILMACLSISRIKKKKKKIYIHIFVISIRFLYVSCMRRDSDCLCQEGLWETGVSTRHKVSLHHHITCRVMSCDIMLYLFISPFYLTTYHTSDTVYLGALWRFSAWLEHRSTPGSDFGAGHGWFFWDRQNSMNHHESASRCAR